MNSGFNLIGISVRTTNQNNKSQADLGQLWERFFAEGIPDKIPEKAAHDIIAVYTDYATDFRGEYTAFLGMPVSDLNFIPEGLEGREFPADHFVRLSATGTLPQAVMDKWAYIWEHDSDLNRKYSYDFEVYDDRSQAGENSEVDIYLSVLE